MVRKGRLRPTLTHERRGKIEKLGNPVRANLLAIQINMDCEMVR